MYPEAELMVAYGEFRAPFHKDPNDSRFVFYGMRYIIENFVAVQWTEEDVEQADLFYRTHGAGNTPFPFPKVSVTAMHSCLALVQRRQRVVIAAETPRVSARNRHRQLPLCALSHPLVPALSLARAQDLFLEFVHENDGYFPVRIEALPEGSVANIHVPVYQIFAYKQYARLVTFLETILTQVWYPSTVATLSRRTKDLVENAFNKSVEPSMHWLVDSRLHDVRTHNEREHDWKLTCSPHRSDLAVRSLRSVVWHARLHVCRAIHHWRYSSSSQLDGQRHDECMLVRAVPSERWKARRSIHSCH